MACPKIFKQEDREHFRILLDMARKLKITRYMYYFDHYYDEENESLYTRCKCAWIKFDEQNSSIKEHVFSDLIFVRKNQLFKSLTEYRRDF